MGLEKSWIIDVFNIYLLLTFGRWRRDDTFFFEFLGLARFRWVFIWFDLEFGVISIIL